MAHDEDFQYLALLLDIEESTTAVQDLMLAGITRIPLKHGSTPPLLVDVLCSAMPIGEHVKLVIEVRNVACDVSPIQLFKIFVYVCATQKFNLSTI